MLKPVAMVGGTPAVGDKATAFPSPGAILFTLSSIRGTILFDQLARRSPARGNYELRGLVQMTLPCFLLYGLGTCAAFR